MKKIGIQYYKFKAGEMILGAIEGKLCLCDWRFRKMRENIDRNIQDRLGAGYVEASSAVTDSAIFQLEEYFEGRREEFDIPLTMAGTEFQVSVWKELMKIPYGETMSYLELAERLGDRKAIRAVAAANGANAISIIVPCHRVIGSRGEMVGYAGGSALKKKLLQMESGRQEPEQMKMFE